MSDSGFLKKHSYDGDASANGYATLSAPSILRSASPSFRPQRVTTFAPTVEIMEDKRMSRDSQMSMTSDDVDRFMRENTSINEDLKSRYVKNLMEVLQR